jgi:hypothetical protein
MMPQLMMMTVSFQINKDDNDAAGREEAEWMELVVSGDGEIIIRTRLLYHLLKIVVSQQSLLCDPMHAEAMVTIL